MWNKRCAAAAALLLIFAMVFSFAACSKVPDSGTFDNSNIAGDKGEASSSVEKPELDKAEETAKGSINPLTGEVTEEDISQKRPIAVMINNHSVAQPQLGVGDADIIYEALVEGGITRMMAVFQDLPSSEILGSIRSSRHYYLDFAAAYDAIYVHAGGSPYAYDAIASRNVDNIDGVKGRGDLFYRDEYRRSAMGFEHSLCITGESILNYLNNESGYRLSHNDDYKCNMTFTENAAPANGASAESVTVHFGLGKDTSFTYDPEKQIYTAAQFGDTYVDGNTGKAVELKNIVVIQTDVRSVDEKDRKDMTLTGTGSGWFISGGKCAEITWSRDNQDAQFVYTFADGTPVSFGIGATYVCVIALSGSVDCN